MDIKNFENLPIFVEEILNWYKKIIKPWKKKKGDWDELDGYAQGWNACLKEVEKNHKKFMEFYKEKFKD